MSSCPLCDQVLLLPADPIVWALAEGTNYISANVEVSCTDACWHPAHLIPSAAACAHLDLHGLAPNLPPRLHTFSTLPADLLLCCPGCGSQDWLRRRHHWQQQPLDGELRHWQAGAALLKVDLDLASVEYKFLALPCKWRPVTCSDSDMLLFLCGRGAVGDAEAALLQE